MATSGLLKPICVEDAKEAHDNQQVVIIDCRPAEDFIECHITKSIYGILDKKKPSQEALTMVGFLISKKKCILLVTETGGEELAYKTLADFGFTMIMG